jgi:prefoldin beta subunit
VLLKQDRTEAESTVNGRLEFINNEMWAALLTLMRQPVEANYFPSRTRQEDQIKETQGKIEKKKAEIIQVQTAA